MISFVITGATYYYLQGCDAVQSDRRAELFAACWLFDRLTVISVVCGKARVLFNMVGICTSRNTSININGPLNLSP
jgi:hypothetical protein